MTKFVKYNSLENHTRAQFIQRVVDHGHARANIMYIALEKVHGSNFSFWVGPEGTRTAKRTSFDSEFGNAPALMQKYEKDCEVLRTRMIHLGLANDADTVVIMGEVFGGSFHGTKAPNAKTIQRGMHYHPDTEFMVFDIGVAGEGETIKYVPAKTMLELLWWGAGIVRQDFMKHVPIVGSGSFDEVIKFNNLFPTLVPEMFGYAVPEGLTSHCTAEGFVMRPYEEELFIGESRVIIKHKNSLFNEKADGYETPTSSSFEVPEGLKELFEELAAMSTKSRLESVFSKEYTADQLSWKMIGELSGKLLQDIVEGYDKEFELDIKCGIGDSWKVFQRNLSKVTTETVREYFKEVL